MTREVAEDVVGLRVPETAHWMVEENPGAFVNAVLEFVGSGKGSRFGCGYGRETMFAAGRIAGWLCSDA